MTLPTFAQQVRVAGAERRVLEQLDAALMALRFAVGTARLAYAAGVLGEDRLRTIAAAYLQARAARHQFAGATDDTNVIPMPRDPIQAHADRRAREREAGK